MIDFKVRRISEGDYEVILSKWWKSWRWTPPAKDSLPENGLGGVIVSLDGVDICAGFLFLTNSKTAWCEYIVSNFEYKDKNRHDAIEFLIRVLTSMAEDRGYKYIYTSLKSKSLIEKYEACGYIVGSENCTEMMKIV